MALPGEITAAKVRKRNVKPARRPPPAIKPTRGTRSGPFGPVGRADRPIVQAQRVAHKRVQRAQTRLPERPLPSIPTIRRPTRRQQQTAISLVRRSTRNLTPSQKRDLSQDPRSRAKLAPAQRAVRSQQRQQNVRIGRALSTPAYQRPTYGPPTPSTPLTMVDALTRRGVEKPRYLPTGRPGFEQVGRQVSGGLRTQAMPVVKPPTFHPSTAGVAAFLSNPGEFLANEVLKQGVATGSAFAHRPGSTAEKTISGLAQQIIGLPAMLGEIHHEVSTGVTHGDVSRVSRGLTRPLVEAQLDYARRYHGSIGERTKRIEQEGAAGEVGDALLALGTVGAAAGRGFVQAARAGALPGRVGEEFFGAERPRLRYSGGTGVREQELANRPVRIALQRGQDAIRRRVQGRVDSEGRVAGLQPQATPTEKSIARQNVKRAAQGREPLPIQGEVTPMFKRTAEREQRIAGSRAGSRSYIGVRHEGAVELTKGVEREIADLSPKQRRAIFHVTQGMVPLEGSIKEIRDALKAREKQILAEQKAKGVSEPRVLKKHTELNAVRFVQEHADEIFADRSLAEFHQTNLERQKRLAEGDQAFSDATGEARRYRPQGEFLGIKYEPPKVTREMNAEERAQVGVKREKYNRAFSQRVSEEATKRGLPEPGYFQHQKRLLPRFGLRSGSQVGRRMKGVKPSEMKLLREGRAVTNPDVLVQGMAENIKRKHQWNAVADVVEENAYGWSRGAKGTGSPLSELLDEIDKRRLRHEDFTFLDTTVMRNGAQAATKAEQALHDALTNSRVAGVNARALVDKGGDLVKSDGFVAFPKGIGDELEAMTRPSGKGMRVFGKLQGLQSAGILGLNPTFLEVQVAANTLQSAAAMRGAMGDLLLSQKWFRDLPPAKQKVFAEANGVGVYEGHTQVAKMGSHAGGLARTLHDIGQVPLVRTGKGTVRMTDLNPTQGIFRMDDMQNKTFRRAVFYNHLKRQAFQDLAKDVGHAQAAFRVLADWAKLKPGESLNDAVTRLLENPQAVEKAARHADDFLGDYLRFTARERKAKPFALFYGFLRYAAKTLFYTLPVKHPLMAAFAYKLGQLHNEELKRLFGRDVPAYALSKALVFDGRGNVVKDTAGQPETIDFGRINPLTSPAVDVVTEGPKALAGLVSPLFQGGVNIVAGENVGLNQPLRLHGSAEQPKRIGPGDAARVIASEGLGSLFPYRQLMAAQTHGAPQGDDSLLFSLRPTHFKSAQAQQRATAQAKAKGPFSNQIVQQLFPLNVGRGDKTLARQAESQTAGAKRDVKIHTLEQQATAMRRAGKAHDPKNPDTMSPEYQALRDRINALRKQKGPRSKPLKRRPLTPEEQMRKEFQDFQHPSASEEEKLRKEFEQFAGR